MEKRQELEEEMGIQRNKSTSQKKLLAPN